MTGGGTTDSHSRLTALVATLAFTAELSVEALRLQRQERKAAEKRVPRRCRDGTPPRIGGDYSLCDGAPGCRKLEAMGSLERITVTPDVRFGKPCVRGTRITVGDVLGYLAGGMSEDQLLADFATGQGRYPGMPGVRRRA